MNKYHYLIVGAGLFGSVFAQQATAAGKKCLVIDKRSHIGGNIYTKTIQDVPVHSYGAHIFHTSDSTVWNYINTFAKFNSFINQPKANFQGKLYNLPFNMNTFFQMWGVTKAEQAQEIIAKQVADSGITNPQNLEEKAISLVGTDIYNTLIKGYTEKQWGCKATELPAFIITRLPVRFTYNNNYFNDCYQGVPENGYTEIIDKMLEGCDIALNTDYFSNRSYFDTIAEKIIFTGSIDSYFDYCYGQLTYRSLRFDTVTLPQEDFQGNAVINYTEADVPFTRIIEHKHFYFDISTPTTTITREYPLQYTVGCEPYYPVNDAANSQLYNRYHVLAENLPNVIFGGRLGLYKYLDMDRIISAALSLAQQELR